MAVGRTTVPVVLQPTSDQHWADALAVGAAIQDAFDTVFADFAPLQTATLDIRAPGRVGLATSGITVTYPDTSPAQVSWVEPSALPGGNPKMRLKHRSSDPRLLGDGGVPATLIPHELAHALHFWLMPRRWRLWVEARYAGWIAGQLARGSDASHSADVPTSPLVAWLEAFGMFAERYWLFRQRHQLPSAQAQSAFVESELTHKPHTGTAAVSRWWPLNVEGAVYRKVFVEYASRTSLATAVSLYLLSGSRGISTYAGFASALSDSPAPPGFPA